MSDKPPAAKKGKSCGATQSTCDFQSTIAGTALTNDTSSKPHQYARKADPDQVLVPIVAICPLFYSQNLSWYM
jgi:hypothetical protein